jgi:hypothetical protein
MPKSFIFPKTSNRKNHFYVKLYVVKNIVFTHFRKRKFAP